MREVSEYKLMKKFNEVFPKEHELLSLAKSQDEIDELHTRFVDEAREKLKTSLKNDGVSDADIHTLSTIPSDETVPIVLTPELHDALIDARKGEITNEIHVVMDVLTRLQKLHNNQLGLAAAELVIGGMLAISSIAASVAMKALFTGSLEEAVLAGVTAMTVASLVAITTFIIIVILIPILFYMQKPANCVIILVNDLDEEIKFVDDYNIHGKPKLMTIKLKPGIEMPGWGFYSVCGLIATSKSKNSFFGTQYGFTFETTSGKRLSFGVENPLTGLSKDNNCYCEVDTNSKNAANQTDKHNKQEWHCTKDGITLEIRCNSGHGSTSYYIARAYNKPE